MLPVAKPYIKSAIDARMMMREIISVMLEEVVFEECLRLTEL